MKAIALTHYLPISDPAALFDTTLEQPQALGRDLLVAIKAIAVNPVDTKVRAPKTQVETSPRVLGWDAAGVVLAVGPEVKNFKVGDQVYYAGDITRPGCNSQFHLVDERIVGHMPATLSFEQAAALPLTAITAWEALFERLRVPALTSATATATRQSILIIGGAGGVGSMAIQLASKVAGLDVIATASRPESQRWVRELGAQHVINHFEDMPAQMQQIGYPQVDYVLILNDTDRHYPAAAQLVAPQGMICTIVENQQPLDVSLLKTKSAGLVWEMMFTRSMFQTADMEKQAQLLDEVARLVDARIIHSTVSQVLTPINSANLRQAHTLIEAGKTIGKIVLKDF